ncbi:pentapeptide repeat-containing protein [Pseudoalteromonas fenneropenaei]|uniref:Pentapeptide repeat-containing protein n=1 Tax=Pseudoalteromonas fenneropenaei TaxID=1737459 RepID=A0ABV7CPT8_9GAMM
MSSDLFKSQLQFMRSVCERCAAELSATQQGFLDELMRFAEVQHSFVLNKTELMLAIEKSAGALTSDNFRKRISQLNLVFNDDESPAGIKFENSKATLTIAFDAKLLEQSLDEETVGSIRRVNESGAPDIEHIIESTASNAMTGMSPQVMFSYCWGGQKKLLERKREFATRLEQALKSPPAKYKNEPKIKLFIDVDGFELGEDQQSQQDLACEQSGAVVVPYCHGYLHSNPCQREIEFFLTEQGANVNGKKAIIAPFNTPIGNADLRYLKNLAAVPAHYSTLLKLLESENESDIGEFVEKIVVTLYEHFIKQKKNLAPLFNEQDEVSGNLMYAAKQHKILSNPEELFAAQGAQISHQYGIKIVPHITKWALSTTSESTRLFYLLGDFGAGKSTTCQLVTNQLTKEYDKAIAAGDTEAVLPIYLDLKKLLNAFNNVGSSLDAPVEKLLETMLSTTGGKPVEGKKIIDFVHKQPALLIFDGFDEVGQKLNEQQQVGLLKKIVEIFPNTVYQQDLLRLQGKASHSAEGVPHRSRILISCRTHFFSSVEKESAFRHLYYRHDAGETIGDVANFQTYYLLPFSKEQIQSYLAKWLGEKEGQKAVQFIERVHDLSGLSERPVMLQFIRQLIPDLMREAEHNSNINAATLYRKLFQRAMTRDAEKHWIDTDEKFQLLARFAVFMWQQKTSQLNQQLLVAWFEQNYGLFTQIKIDIQQGKVGIKALLQDLFNACLLVRDNEDNYRFAHTSFYEFFLACGLFELVRNVPPNWQQGFDVFGNEVANHGLSLNQETQQFLIDWRLTTNPQHLMQFDNQWQRLQQQPSEHDNKQLAFELWYLAYRTTQPFTLPKHPNWSGINLQEVNFEHTLDLRGADFSHCLISQSLWRNIDLSHSHFAGARIMQSHFAHCNFDRLQSAPNSVQFGRFWQCQYVERFSVGLSSHNQANFNMPTLGLNTMDNLQLRLPTFGDANALCYHPDGSELFFAGDDGIVRSVDLASGEVREIAQAKGGVYCLSYHPDGSALSFAGSEGIVCSVDLASFEVREVAQAKYGLHCLSYHPDGSALAFGGWDDIVRSVDLASCEVREIAQVKGRVTCLSYHPDGSALSFAGDEGVVRSVDLDSFEVRDIAQVIGEVSCLSYHPDGSALSFAGDDGIVRSIDLASGELREIAEAKGEVSCLSYHPDGGVLSFAGDGRIVCSVDLESGEVRELAQAKDGVSCLSYHPDGSALSFVGDGGIVRSIDLASSEVREIAQAKGRVTCLSYHPDGSALSFGGSDGIVFSVNLASFEVHEIAQAKARVHCLSYHPDGSALAFGGGDGIVRSVDLASGEVREIAQVKGRVTCLSYHPDGSALAFGGSDGIVCSVDLVNVEVRELAQAKDWVTCLSYHPDGSVLSFVGWDGIACSIDLDSFEVREIAQVEGIVTCLSYHPDGSALSFGVHYGIAYSIDLVSFEVREIAQVKDGVYCLSYHPDGSALSFVGDGGIVRSVDLVSFEVREIAQKKGRLNCLSYHPDGNVLSFAGWAGGVHIHDGHHAIEVRVHRDSYFVLVDNAIVKVGGEAWRYVTAVKEGDGFTYEVEAPTRHPNWANLQRPFCLH